MPTSNTQTIKCGELEITLPVWANDPYTDDEIEAMRMRPPIKTIPVKRQVSNLERLHTEGLRKK